MARSIDDNFGEKKRRQILDGARAVFLRDGYEGGSMETIAQAAEVSKGTLYNHFKSKQILFEAVISDYCSTHTRRIFTIDSDEPDFRATLKRVGVDLLSMLVKPASLSVHRVVMAEAPTQPEVAAAFERSGPQICIDRLSEYLAVLSRKGLMQVDDPQEAAEVYFEMIQGGIMRRTLMCVIPTPDGAAITCHVDRVLKIFLSAYAVTEEGLPERESVRGEQ